MNKFKFISFAFALLLGASFVACSDDDAPAYEQVIVNQAASDGLRGKVKSVEATSFASDYDEDAGKAVKGDPYHKTVTFYDKKGMETGYEYYSIYGSNKFRISGKSEYVYDKRYRVTSYLEEDYDYSGDNATVTSMSSYKSEIVYDDSKKTATVSRYEWDAESKKYVLANEGVYSLNPNGTIDEDVYTATRFERVRNASDVVEYKQKSERIIEAEDAKKNWTKAYVKYTSFDEDGEVSYIYTRNYQERTILYY